MLDACCPDWRCAESDEYYTIYWKEFVFPRLTRGSHRQRGKASAEIHLLHVRKLARRFGVMECARKYFPGI